MTPQHVLDTLTATGIRVEAENGNLRYHSHTPLDGELINLIRSHKAGLVRLLEAREALPSSQGAADAMPRFRSWWWEVFDCEGDEGEFNAGSSEAAQELLPILRNLTWPDFVARAEGPTLKLRRVRERHYPKRSVCESEGCDDREPATVA